MRPQFEEVFALYAQYGIKIQLIAKQVKNINFRLKPIPLESHAHPVTSLLTVSYPARMPDKLLLESLKTRLTWAIACQSQLLKKRQIVENNPKQTLYFNDINDLQNLTLNSEIYFVGEKITVQALFSQQFKSVSDFSNVDIPQSLVSIYKNWLIKFIQNRQYFWQQKIGKNATKITPYAMKSRWGSCSTHAKTIRLSVWLAQYPPDCSDYVLVHELCHLHEANHSPRFWQHVERVMPDYKIWHDKLKNKA